MSTFLLRFQPLARDWPRLGSSLLSLPSSLPPSRIGSSSKLFQLAIVAECNRRHLGSIAKNNSSSRSARLVLVNQAGLPHPSQVFFDLISTWTQTLVESGLNVVVPISIESFAQEREKPGEERCKSNTIVDEQEEDLSCKPTGKSGPDVAVEEQQADNSWSKGHSESTAIHLVREVSLI